jgi:hypothetical protein
MIANNLILLNVTNWDFAITVTYVGFSIVFIALLFLFLTYLFIPKALDLYTRARLRRQGKKCAETSTLNLSGNVNAAIGMAIMLFMHENHDIESGKITAKKLSKRYSPWSSKIYTIMGGLNSRF